MKESPLNTRSHKNYDLTTPMGRIDAIVKEKYARNRKGFIVDYFVFEVKRILREAQGKGRFLEIKPFLMKFGKQKVHKRILQGLLRTIEQKGGVMQRPNVYMLPDEDVVKDLQSGKFDITPTEAEYGNLIRTFVARHAQRKVGKVNVHEHYRHFLCASVHEGGLGVNWKFVDKGGELESAFIEEGQSYRTMLEKQAEDKLAKQKEKYEKAIARLSMEKMKLQERLEKMEERLDSAIDEIQQMMSILEITDSNATRELAAKIRQLPDEVSH